LHTISPKQVLNVLFTDQRHPLNLHRQFVARWDSAPSKIQAAISFAAYCSMLCAKTIKYGVFRRRECAARKPMTKPKLIFDWN
jgi:hypothetical protein